MEIFGKTVYQRMTGNDCQGCDNMVYHTVNEGDKRSYIISSCRVSGLKTADVYLRGKQTLEIVKLHYKGDFKCPLGKVCGKE